MKTKREEKLEQQLSACRKALHRERQKNRDLIHSRSKYKLKHVLLTEQLKEAAAIKKTDGRSFR